MEDAALFEIGIFISFDCCYFYGFPILNSLRLLDEHFLMKVICEFFEGDLQISWNLELPSF